MYEPTMHGLEEFHRFPWDRLIQDNWSWTIAQGGGPPLNGEWYIYFTHGEDDRRDIWIIPHGVITLIEFCRREGCEEAQEGMRQSMGLKE